MFHWVVLSFLILLLSFQNCSPVNFVSMPSYDPNVPFCTDVTAEQIQPKLKWDWYSQLDQSIPENFPDFKQVMSTPMVGDLDGDGSPEVVFSTYQGSAYSSKGVLRIVDGRTGLTLNSIGTDELAPFATVSPLLIDIDADGKLEIIYPHFDQAAAAVVALNFDGTKRWVFNLPDGTSTQSRKGFAAADLDKDGRAEIIVNHNIVAEDSSLEPFLKMTLPKTASAGWIYAISLDWSKPKDLNLVSINAVFTADGTKLFDLEPMSYAVANIDTEPQMEIVGTSAGWLRVYDAKTGVIESAIDLTVYNDLQCSKGIGGGPPTLGDFDGNPKTTEVAMATGKFLTIMDWQGQLIAKYETQDCSSLSTGISSFDFNGDGKPEILYGDEEYFRIFELHKNELRVIFSTVNPSGTLNEYPVVADIDGNKSSELLVVANNYAVGGFYKDPNETEDGVTAAGITGVRAFEATKKASWMPTRSIWNQFDYNPALVSDDGKAVAFSSLDDFTARMFRRNAQLGMFEQRCQ